MKYIIRVMLVFVLMAVLLYSISFSQEQGKKGKGKEEEGILYVSSPRVIYQKNKSILINALIKKGDKYTIKAATITYQEKDKVQIAEGSGDVEILMKDATVTAEQFKFNLNKNTGDIDGDVLFVKTKNGTVTRVKCAHISADIDKDIYSGYATSGKRVEITKEKWYVLTDNFLMNSPADKITLEGHVHIVDTEKNDITDAEKVIWNTKDDSMVLLNVKMKIHIRKAGK